MSTDYRIVIPARMAAQRLPGKPLTQLAGRSLIEHVYRCAQQSSAIEIVIATDDSRIADAAQRFGAAVQMTSSDHCSGSDRIAECCRQRGWANTDIVVNLQGDEPLMPPACLDQVAALLAADAAASVASLYWPIESEHEANDPACVKVVLAEDNAALYFSRALIPYPRAWETVHAALATQRPWLRHVGLYAYRVKALNEFSALSPSPLERAEKLEQLRLLQAGKRLVLAQACQPIPAGVDTPDDLARVERILVNYIN